MLKLTSFISIKGIFCFFFKGNVNVILSDPPLTEWNMSDLQRYPKNVAANQV